MSTAEADINELLELAEKAISDEALDSELFLQSVAEYLEALETWRGSLPTTDAGTPAREEMKAALGRLNETHKTLLERSNVHREKLMGQMGDAQKKAKALRTYVDRFPDRITIAGKRKG